MGERWLKRLCAWTAALLGAACLALPGVAEADFLSDYADYDRIGDWYIACAAPSEDYPESATRNPHARWSLLDGAGRVLIDGGLRWTTEAAWPGTARPFFGFPEGEALAPVRVGERWGYVSRAGALAVAPAYDEAGFFTAGEPLAAVRDGDRWGAVDREGTLVIPAIYDVIEGFSGGRSVVALNGRFGYIDTSGRSILDPVYRGIDIAPGADYGRVLSGNAYALMARDGRLLSDFLYADIAVGAGPLFSVRRGEGYGFIDASGAEVIPARYLEAGTFSEGLAAVRDAGSGLWGYVDAAGAQVIDPVFAQAGPFSGGLAPVATADGWGFAGRDGALAIPARYAEVAAFEGGYARVRTDGGWGLIDRAGNQALETAYARVAFSEDGVVTALAAGGAPRFFELSTGAARPVETLSLDLDLSDYMPFTGGLTPSLDAAPTLSRRASDSARLPRLDGAEAAFPVYAAFAQAVYPKDTRYARPADDPGTIVACSGTSRAYARLIAGEADIAFAAAPSDRVLAAAAEQGVELELLPLAREAFAFVVPRTNPLSGLSLDQLRAVYSGEIDAWTRLDAYGLGRIVAYQCAGSGVGQARLAALMNGVPLAEAPREVVGWDADGGVEAEVLEPVPYRGLPNAIGCAHRFFLRRLGGAAKLLAVDGALPLDDNLRSGRYPLVETLYAVRAKGNKNPNLDALWAWMQTAQAMSLVEKAGYAPALVFDASGAPLPETWPEGLEGWDELRALGEAPPAEAAPAADTGDAPPEAAEGYLARLGDKWALLSGAGEVLLRPCMTWDPEKDARPPFTGFGAGGLGAVRIDGRWGLIDATGAVVLPALYDSLPEDPAAGGVVLRDGLYGYLRGDGALLAEPVYEAFEAFSENAAAVRLNGLWGYLRPNGEWLAPPAFEAAEPFSNGYARVRLDGRWGYIDADGQLAVEARYAAAEDFRSLYAAVSPGDGKWGIINAEGEALLKPEFDRITRPEGMDQFAIAEKKGVALYYNLYAREAVELSEDDGENLRREGYRAFQAEDGVGLSDGAGRCVLAPLYIDVRLSASDGAVLATLDSGEMRTFDLSGGVARPVETVQASFSLYDYAPNAGSAALATLAGAPTLAWDPAAPLPRLDGATALFPVYAAFVQAVYPEDTRYEPLEDGASPLLTCTRTDRAYERLIAGDADVIFVAGPSDEELAMAEARGVTLELTPIGREAFVFIVNQDNPLSDIGLEQIRGVYSGRITRWSQLGVEGLGDIVAYQRPKNSGSQTALERLMGDVPLMAAPEGVVAWDMGDIVDTIEYRNLPNAIGYTFRFFCTEMMKSAVKLLAVDGVAPTPQNIRAGAYPITSTVYAVRLTENDNPNVAALLDWIQSEQGMELIEKTGYTPG